MDAEQAVVLVPSRYEEWVRRYGDMASHVTTLVPGAVVEHIGSTAVPGLPAKDVVDVMVGVDARAVRSTARRLAAAGLDLEGERDHHCWLSAPDRSDRAYVVHVVEHGGRPWTRRVAFRDLLRGDAAARAAYLDVKREAARSTRGWDAYTQAKTGVVAELLDRAAPDQR
ncbi:GrpB family protein [Georgenia wangjunii]|uniref:GrpB family protein n=1 Tax=Georgenia wangjunii TaxID=3117730 RepID=UPI002F26B282